MNTPVGSEKRKLKIKDLWNLSLTNSLDFVNGMSAMVDIPQVERALVTGGAGFIGSHLVDRLLADQTEVVVLDSLASGRLENLATWNKHSSLQFIKADLRDLAKLPKAAINCETVFHLAANPDVQSSSCDPGAHYANNLVATFNLLEAIRKAGGVKTLVFTSTSTVYGDAVEIPTSEDYSPLLPVSIYGACKLASEALIVSYAYNYGFNALICRLANVIGSRSQHGIVHDFIDKLRKNPKRLEILGDGTQTKSYLHVADCVEAILTGIKRLSEGVGMYNVGSEDQANVKQIANIVCDEMGLKNVEYCFTGGVDGGRGWKGDVKIMLLRVEKLKKLGWEPKLNSCGAIRKTVKELLYEGS